MHMHSVFMLRCTNILRFAICCRDLLRLLNSDDHWAVLMIRKGETAKQSVSIVFDGLFKKTIKDCAMTLTTYLMGQWFGFDESTDCRARQGRCPLQKDSWSCGHRVVLVFDALIALKCFHPRADGANGGFQKDIAKVTLEHEHFQCLATKKDFEAAEKAVFAMQVPIKVERPETPRKKRPLPDPGNDDVMSPPPPGKAPKKAKTVSKSDTKDVGGTSLTTWVGLGFFPQKDTIKHKYMQWMSGMVMYNDIQS